jgi:arginine/lysine/ornithine decarboxylase
LADLISKIGNLKEELTAVGFELLNQRENSVLKLAISGLKLGVTGFDLAEHLRVHNIYVEHFDYNCIVLIVGAKNSPADFKRLRMALKRVVCGAPLTNINYSLRQELEIREKIFVASFMSYKPSPIEESEGKLIAGPVGVKCPPCVPLIMPGEIVTSSVIDALKACGHGLINCGELNL